MERSNLEKTTGWFCKSCELSPREGELLTALYLIDDSRITQLRNDWGLEGICEVANNLQKFGFIKYQELDEGVEMSITDLGEKFMTGEISLGA